MTEQTGPLDDDPVGRDGDVLQRRRYVSQMAETFGRFQTQRSSSVVALVGPWGAGKSSLIKMLQETLEDTEVWSVVPFNPWFYQDLPSLQLGFLNAVEDAVGGAGFDHEKVRNGFGAIAKSIAPLAELIPVVGGAAKMVVDAAGDQLLKVKSPDEAQEQIAKLLDEPEREKSILIVMDDLDRLSPEELLLVFKLIRLVGRLPWVHYLIAYDEATLLDVLSRTGLVGANDVRRGVDYVEKIVQLRVDVPPLRREQLAGLIETALDEMSSSVGLQLTRGAEARFRQFYFDILLDRLTTPRSIKRFVSQCEAFYTTLRDEVDPSDYLIVTWLRVFEPLLYGQLANMRDDLIGKEQAPALALSKPADRRSSWELLLKRTRVRREHRESIARVLCSLFPRFAAIWNSKVTWDNAQPEQGRVGHPDYFDRYFAFEVPDSDISDSLVASALGAIVGGTDSSDKTALAERLITETTRVVIKVLHQYEQSPEPTRAAALLLWLADGYHLAPEENTFVSSTQHIEFATRRLFQDVDPDQIRDITERVFQVPDGLRLGGELLTPDQPPEAGGESDDSRAQALAAARQQLLRRIEQLWDRFTTTGPIAMATNEWRLFWTWYQFDVEGLCAWLRERFDSGDWSRLDVASRLVGTRVLMGVPDASPTLTELDLDVVDRVMGTLQLREEVGTKAIAHAGPLNHSRRLPDTVENRRTVVASSLTFVANKR